MDQNDKGTKNTLEIIPKQLTDQLPKEHRESILNMLLQKTPKEVLNETPKEIRDQIQEELLEEIAKELLKSPPLEGINITNQTDLKLPPELEGKEHLFKKNKDGKVMSKRPMTSGYNEDFLFRTITRFLDEENSQSSYSIQDFHNDILSGRLVEFLNEEVNYSSRNNSDL